MAYKPPLPKAPEPQSRGRAFDPWNSVAAGHQRAETRGPSGWRESRAHKLNSQFRSDSAGGRRLQDAVGPGADPDRLRRALGPPEHSVLDLLRKPGTMKKPGMPPPPPPAEDDDGPVAAAAAVAGEADDDDDAAPGAKDKGTDKDKKRRRGIFDGLVVYINGSTHPLISDHKLKRVLADEGARTALHLGRRQVTHVVVGRPAAAPGGTAPAGGSKGAGGGLAGGKIQREIARLRGGCGVKFVGVEWCVPSPPPPPSPLPPSYPAASFSARSLTGESSAKGP